MGTSGNIPAVSAGRAAVSSLALTMLLLSAMVALPAPSGGIPTGTPKLIISLQPSSSEAHVSPSSQGSLAFCGTVNVENAIGNIQLTLISSVDTGWASQCSPSSLVFQDDSNHSFQVTVIVPQATPASVVGTLKVDAKAQGTGYTLTESAQAVVTVKPYYMFKLNCTNPFLEIKPSYEAVYEFRVLNEGNSVDSFELEVSNQKELESKGWTVTLSSAQITGVQPGLFSSTFRVSAQSPKENTVMTSEPTMINLKATSNGAKSESLVVTQSFPLYVQVKGSYVGAQGVAEALPVLAIVVVIAIVVAVAAVVIVRRRHSRGE